MMALKPPMIRVHGTVDGSTHQASVVIRDREMLEDSIARGAAYILDAVGGTYLTEVWSETMNYFEFEKHQPLMGTRFYGGILSERGDR